MINSNNVYMKGKLTHLTPIWQNNEEMFYRAFIEINRSNNNNVVDKIPIVVPGNALKEIDLNNEIIIKSGQIRGKDVYSDEAEKLKVEFYINVKEISSNVDYEDNNEKDNNLIKLDGYVCKKPILRTTPSGKQITDLLIACNYGKDKTAYLPVIVWGRNARIAGKFNVGDLIGLEGRFQCRPYIKNIDGISYEKIAYEISANKIMSM